MQNLEQHDIYKLIATRAYWNRAHPEHDLIQDQIKSWFQHRYKDNSEENENRPNIWSSLGNALFLGEGNFSFSRSIAMRTPSAATHITATVFEKEKDISDEARQNAMSLEKQSVNVLYGIDATDLSPYFERQKFDTIIFQFPHTGSRDPLYGRNPNFVLIRRFLKSALNQLTFNGKIIVTTVDNPHYQGAFQLEDAAKEAGYNPPEGYSFDITDFPDYNHVNTHQGDSALEDHTSFKSWIFEPKKQI
jgi:25S rRNA (uracil2634-N3)-methyltransferase